MDTCHCDCGACEKRAATDLSANPQSAFAALPTGGFFRSGLNWSRPAGGSRMPWTVEINYVAVETLGIPELGIVAAEWNPPGPGPERFNYFDVMLRADIQNPSGAKFMQFVDDATAAALEWNQSNSWSDADSPAVEAALEAALP